jgi:hypothetical protein
MSALPHFDNLRPYSAAAQRGLDIGRSRQRRFTDRTCPRVIRKRPAAIKLRTRAIVESYLREMGVPAKYADEMFSESKDSIRWISHEEVRADFDGFITELRDWAEDAVITACLMINAWLKKAIGPDNRTSQCEIGFFFQCGFPGSARGQPGVGTIRRPRLVLNACPKPPHYGRGKPSKIAGGHKTLTRVLAT